MLQSHGDSALIGALDSKIVGWNVDTNENVFDQFDILNCHQKPITSLLFNSDNNKLISGSRGEKEIRIWNVSNGQLLDVKYASDAMISMQAVRASTIAVKTETTLDVFHSDKDG